LHDIDKDRALRIQRTLTRKDFGSPKNEFDQEKYSKGEIYDDADENIIKTNYDKKESYLTDEFVKV
jgi:hypothetical protein